MARNEKNQQGKTKNGLQYYIFPKKEFGEKAAAIPSFVLRSAPYASTVGLYLCGWQESWTPYSFLLVCFRIRFMLSALYASK